MATSNRHLRRLRPTMRAAILGYLADHPRDRPVHVATVIHQLAQEGMTVSRSEFVLKNAIAEAAISQGFTVGFGRPALGLGLSFHHPIRRALVQLRRLKR